jgi:hypothetical protein
MSPRTARTATLTVLLVLVGAAWVVSVGRMTGMGMASGLGSRFFSLSRGR